MERHFLAACLTSAAFLAGAMLAANTYVDPYARWAPPGKEGMIVDANGFDRTPAYTLNRRLFKVISFERWMAENEDGPPSILIGDSTANQISARDLTALTHRPWFSLAYGGATLAESIDLVDFVINRYEVKEIAWALPFNRFISGAPNEMPRTVEMADAPTRHMMTVETLQASYLVLRQNWLGVGFDDPKLDTGGEDVVTYQLSRAAAEIAGRPWPADLVKRLDATIRRAKRRGIDVVIFAPPVHPRTQVMYEAEFPDRLQQYLDLLSDHNAVDFNDPEHCADWPAELFVDPYHLTPDLKPRLAQELAASM